MNETERHILIVEQDHTMRNGYIAAFTSSGYHVIGTDDIAEAALMIKNCNKRSRHFDLVILDIAEGKQRKLVADIQRINVGTPVLAVISDEDKLLIIDLPNEKRREYIEHFIRSYANAPFNQGIADRL
jgi:DNA-binding NtrC family response regulator